MGPFNPAPAGDPPPNPPTGDPPAGDPPASGAVERPEWMPEELWGDTGFDKAKFDALKATPTPAADLPATAEAYALPAIEGFDTEKAKTSPLFKALMTGAHANGIGQEAFNGVIKTYVEQMTTDATTSEAAERAKLGTNAADRIKAVETWVSGSLSQQEAAALMAGATTADAVIALEKLMNARAPTAPRDPPPPVNTGKTEAQIRDLMNTPAYSGKAHERQQAVIDEVTKWFQDQAAAKAKAGG